MLIQNNLSYKKLQSRNIDEELNNERAQNEMSNSVMITAKKYDLVDSKDLKKMSSIDIV